MRTYLVTGGAGFIGSNYIHYMFKKYDNEIRIINVDVLTYAGNLENLKDIEDRDNYTFIKADICDKEAIAKIFAENDSFACYLTFKRTTIGRGENIVKRSKGYLMVGCRLAVRLDKSFGEVAPYSVPCFLLVDFACGYDERSVPVFKNDAELREHTVHSVSRSTCAMPYAVAVAAL